MQDNLNSESGTWDRFDSNNGLVELFAIFEREVYVLSKLFFAYLSTTYQLTTWWLLYVYILFLHNHSNAFYIICLTFHIMIWYQSRFTVTKHSTPKRNKVFVVVEIHHTNLFILKNTLISHAIQNNDP